MSELNRDGFGQTAHLSLIATSAVVALYSQPMPIEDLYCLAPMLDGGNTEISPSIAAQDRITVQPELFLQPVDELFSDRNYARIGYQPIQEEVEGACRWRDWPEKCGRRPPDCRALHVQQAAGGRGIELLENEMQAQQSKRSLINAQTTAQRADALVQGNSSKVEAARQDESRYSKSYSEAVAAHQVAISAQRLAHRRRELAKRTFDRAARRAKVDRVTLLEEMASAKPPLLKDPPKYLVVQMGPRGRVPLDPECPIAAVHAQARPQTLRERPRQSGMDDAREEEMQRRRNARELAMRSDVWRDIEGHGLPLAIERVKDEKAKRQSAVEVLNISFTREQLCRFAPIALLAFLLFVALHVQAGTVGEERRWFVYFSGRPAALLTFCSFAVVPLACVACLSGCATYACTSSVWSWLTESWLAAGLTGAPAILSIALAIWAHFHARKYSQPARAANVSTRMARIPSGRLLSLRLSGRRRK